MFYQVASLLVAKEILAQACIIHGVIMGERGAPQKWAQWTEQQREVLGTEEPQAWEEGRSNGDAGPSRGEGRAWHMVGAHQ